MKIQVITLFPEMFTGVLGNSMLWKAADRGIVQYEFINLRDFGLGPRRQVDDTPYGGGDGMLLKPEPLVAAIEFAKSKITHSSRSVILSESEESPKNQEDSSTTPLSSGSAQNDKIQTKVAVILPTPRGKIYKQSDAKRLAAEFSDLIIVCPRYEGYDERVTQWIDEQFCIGNYVLTGGELPAMTIIDSVVRLLPGVLGGETSADIESFQDDDENIEYPQYTRPEEFRSIKVPEVLLSGNHAAIAKWRTSSK